MSVATEVKVISVLTGPMTLGEIADRAGELPKVVLPVLTSLLAEGTVKRQGSLFWLARQ